MFGIGVVQSVVQGTKVNFNLNFWICHTRDVFVPVDGRLSANSEIIGSVEVLTNSSSIVKGQYLTGRYFGWLSIPDIGLNKTV